MILVNIHTFPLFSMMQQSSTQSDIPFWIIPVVIVLAVVVVLLLHIVEEEDNDAAHDDHHEPEETVPADVMAKAVVIEEETEVEVASVIVEVEEEPDEPVEAEEEIVEKAPAVEEVVEAEEVVEEEAEAIIEETPAVEEETEAEAVVEEAPIVEEVVETAVIPEPEEPEPVVPDNLRKIEGIGPKISGILNDSGIFTFAQLAASSVAHLNKVVREDAGIRIAYPDTWPEQAQLAADGQWDALETLQDKLVGGRYAK